MLDLWYWCLRSRYSWENDADLWWICYRFDCWDVNLRCSGSLVGIPTLRLKGDYLAIATLGVAEIIRILIINGGSVTNGAAGIMSIPLFTSWPLVYIL